MVAITSVQPMSLPAFPTTPFFLPAQEVRGLQHLLHLGFPHIRCSGEISEPAEALQQLFFFLYIKAENPSFGSLEARSGYIQPSRVRWGKHEMLSPGRQ